MPHIWWVILYSCKAVFDSAPSILLLRSIEWTFRLSNQGCWSSASIQNTLRNEGFEKQHCIKLFYYLLLLIFSCIYLEFVRFSLWKWVSKNILLGPINVLCTRMYVYYEILLLETCIHCLIFHFVIWFSFLPAMGERKKVNIYIYIVYM